MIPISKSLNINVRLVLCYSYVLLVIMAGILGPVKNVAAETSIADAELDVMVNSLERADRLKAFRTIAQDKRKIVDYEMFMPWLLIGANDADKEVRKLAFRALTGIAYVHQNKNIMTDDATRKKFMQVTTKQMDSEDKRARKVATEFYTIALKPTEDELINLLRREGSSAIKKHVIRAVRANGYESDATKQALIDTLGSPDRIGSYSAVVLSQMSQPPLKAVPLIVEQLESDDNFVDDFLLKALEKYGSYAKPYTGRIAALLTKIDSGEKQVRNFEYISSLINKVVKTLEESPELTPGQKRLGQVP